MKEADKKSQLSAIEHGNVTIWVPYSDLNFGVGSAGGHGSHCFIEFAVVVLLPPTPLTWGSLVLETK